MNQIRTEFDVRIKFPRLKTEKEVDSSNGANIGTASDSNSKITEESSFINTNSPSSSSLSLSSSPTATTTESQMANNNSSNSNVSNIVLISGRKENCEKAKEALLALIPVTITVSIPYEFHRFVIGQKGVGVRELMDRCNVSIRVPPPADRSNDIAVTGSKESVEKAQQELNKKLVELETEKADREARNFHLTFQVDPQYHPKIIGKRGTVINPIRSKYKVQIQV